MKKIIIITFSIFFILGCSKTPKKSEIRNNKIITNDSLNNTNNLLGKKNIKDESDKPEIDTLSVVKNVENKKKTRKSRPLKLQTAGKMASNKKNNIVNKIQDKIIDDKKNQPTSDLKKAIDNKAEDLDKTESKKITTTKKIVKHENVEPKIDERMRSFVKKKNKINGDWSFKQEGNKIYIIFYGNFKTKKGPDLEIFLSKKNIADVNSKNALVESLFLENLTSNSGEQKYLIPSSIDLSQYKSIIIHCKKYAVLWGGSSF